MVSGPASALMSWYNVLQLGQVNDWKVGGRPRLMTHPVFVVLVSEGNAWPLSHSVIRLSWLIFTFDEQSLLSPTTDPKAPCSWGFLFVPRPACQRMAALISLTMKHAALASSTDQGGGKRRRSIITAFAVIAIDRRPYQCPLLRDRSADDRRRVGGEVRH